MVEFSGLPFDDEDDREPARPRPLTVSELTGDIRQVMEGTFSSVAVEGELSNCRQWSSGHLYFTLKDDRAQLRGVMFRTTVRTLRFAPEDGMHVVARGRLSVYDAKGEYQVICDSLEPHGLGALQAAFEQLKRRLQAEGLFDTARKRALPVLPRRIGIVTSPDGAALRDILRILTTRHPGARVVIRPARVQGDGAADDLIRALRALAKVPDVEVVIIGRGGGSAEDLWAFNDERLARAIAASPIPVISAVGHEVDFTIADFVADVRAATPSNAAELVVDRADSFRRRIDTAHGRLKSTMQVRVTRARTATVRLRSRLDHWSTVVVLRDRDCRHLRIRLDRAIALRMNHLDQRWDTARRRLEARDLRRVAAALRTRLVAADERARATIASISAAARARFGTATAQLDALSPLGVLGRGYAVCWNATHDAIIRSARSVEPGDAVHVRVSEGELACRVESTRVED
jgi:exodeoxyribonuclease VII large subunit